MESSVALPRGRSPLMTSGRGERISLGRAWIAVGLLTLVALALRIVLMGDSLSDDELFMYGTVHNQSISNMFSVVQDHEKTPPLFFVLDWLTIKLGDPTVWMRLPSLLCGLASVPLAFALGHRVAGRRVGLVTAALVTLSPFAIYYATNARAYAGLAFLAALSTYCLLRALDGNRRGWWAAYGIAVVAVLYTHYAGIFVLIAQALWALVMHREQWRQWLVVHVLVAVAYIPWISSFLVQRRHSGDEAQRIAALAPPTVKRFLNDDFRVFFGHPLFDPRTIPGKVAVAVVLAVVGIAAAYALFRVARSRGRDVRLGSPLALVILLAVITPIGVGLASVRPDRSFLLPRNMAASLLFGEIVVGWLLVSLGRRVGPLAALAVLAVLVGVGVGTVMSLDLTYRKTQYRAAARYIDARSRPGDPVVQASFFPIGGDQADVLRLNFDQPHLLTFQTAPSSPAWAAGRRTGRVFYVVALPLVYAATGHLPERTGPGDAFRLVNHRRYPGFLPILVGEYVRRP